MQKGEGKRRQQPAATRSAGYKKNEGKAVTADDYIRSSSSTDRQGPREQERKGVPHGGDAQLCSTDGDAKIINE